MAYRYMPRGAQRRRRNRQIGGPYGNETDAFAQYLRPDEPLYPGDTPVEARAYASRAVADAQNQAMRANAAMPTAQPRRRKSWGELTGQVLPRVGPPIYRPGYGPRMSDEELGVPPEIRRQRHETRYALPHLGTIPGGTEAMERAREAEELAANQERGFSTLRGYERKAPFGSRAAAFSAHPSLPSGFVPGETTSMTWEDWKAKKFAQRDAIARGETPEYVPPWAGKSGVPRPKSTWANLSPGEKANIRTRQAKRQRKLSPMHERQARIMIRAQMQGAARRRRMGIYMPRQAATAQAKPTKTATVEQQFQELRDQIAALQSARRVPAAW